MPGDRPKTGTFRGRTIDLDEAERTLSPGELAEVVVDLPGVGRVRPWRFTQAAGDGAVDSDGATLL